MKIIKILIVEDTIINTYLLKTYFQKYNIEILSSIDGKEGIEIFKNNPDINLILMNYQMPIMNGFDATREIRKFNNDIGIIATSASLRMLQEGAMESGCNDYVTLPVNFTTLKDKIEKYSRIKLELK